MPGVGGESQLRPPRGATPITSLSCSSESADGTLRVMVPAEFRTEGLGSSVEDGSSSFSLGAGVSYEDCDIYVNADDGSQLTAWLKVRLGDADDAGELTVGPVRVHGTGNGYATAGSAHPFDFLQWETVLECEAPPTADAHEVVAAITAVLQTLWHQGYLAIAACEFEDDLPTSGGIARYPAPPRRESPAPGGRLVEKPFPKKKKGKKEPEK